MKSEARTALFVTVLLAAALRFAAAQAAVAPACRPAAEQTSVASGLSYLHLKQCTPAGELWSAHVLQMDRRVSRLAARAVSGHGPEHDSEMQRELPTQMAAEAAAAGANVLAVVNGDYDGAVLGVSLGVSITSGRLWTAKQNGEPAFALLRSGEPVIGIPQVSIQLRQGRRTWQIPVLNKPLDKTGAVLYSRDFRGSIKSERPMRAIVIGELSPGLPLRASSQLLGKISAKIEKTDVIQLPNDALVLVEDAERDAVPQSAFRRLRVGDKVRLTFAVQIQGHKDLRDVVGGRPIIVRNGYRDLVGLGDQYLEKRHPRTAACYNDDQIIFVVVDGRQPKLSVGMTLEELADLMVSLGCRLALNLDGGGSSVMAVALPGNGGASATHESDPPVRIVNSPSDGKERGRGNAWILVRQNQH